MDWEYCKDEMAKGQGNWRWRKHALNTVFCLGQVCAAVPVVLYRPDQHTLGKCADSVEFYRSGLRRLVQPVSDTDVHGLSSSSDLCFQIVLPLLANPTVESDPSIFVSACLALSLLITVQYHRNESNRFQRPFLLVGICWVLLLSASVCSSGALLTTATATIPSAMVLCLSLSQVLDAGMGCCKTLRAHHPRNPFCPVAG